MSADEPLHTGISPKLRRELGLALADELETDLMLQQALDDPVHNQGAVEWVWRRIADGTANLAARDTWITAVARRVVANVLDQTVTSRPQEALKALHLHSRQERNWFLRYDLEVLDNFEGLRDPEERLTRREVVKLMQARGHLEGKSINAAMKVIDRLRYDPEWVRKERRPPADPSNR
jgi:hypothetical protein